ncbi:MAG: WD40 repeat domain-containing protein [Gemmataceae bacterium]
MMMKLRLLPVGSGPEAEIGEIYSCVYTPDSRNVLSGGWDGQLHLWDARDGAHLLAVSVSAKPISACAVTPDGKYWLSGSLEGMLAHWEATSQRQASIFLAHNRPISAIVFGLTNHVVATASWDTAITLWTLDRQRAGKTLNGHRDIVAGCRFTPDGEQVFSWSHDGTVRLWHAETGQPLHDSASHNDRVTAGDVSPDGVWGVSGGRDGMIKLWNLKLWQEVASFLLGNELNSCLFLRDGKTLVVADARGKLTLHTLPHLDPISELDTFLPVQCAALAPASDQIALGCADGTLRLVAVAGLEQEPLMVTALRTSRRTANAWQRLLGKSQITHAYHCRCPVCQHSVPLANEHLGQTISCPHCHRALRLAALAKLPRES